VGMGRRIVADECGGAQDAAVVSMRSMKGQGLVPRPPFSSS
jgi:hypothetical protein